MLFNSLDFAIFLPIFFILYWFFAQKNLRFQNILILFGSYVFYGWWDWRFLSLIFFSTVVDYLIGYALGRETSSVNRKILLWTSISVNIGLLGFFKYYNFFLESFESAFSFFGYQINSNTLNIILPVGISFYTFQTLSYTIDIYKKKLYPTKDFIAFASFVSFFPQLVAGPIERASHLLPQFFKKRVFSYEKSVDGCRQILWGLFKKVVIADNCAVFVNQIFNNSQEESGSTLFIGAVLFAFQIYGDFSGYSDIAIGTSRLFGFDIMKNFAFPYFSRDIAEFWRRWHISLSTWFRDYLYIPLGGSKGGKWMKIRNTFIIFLVSGFWHGANWTFLAWGFLNALYFIPLQLLNKNRLNLDIVAKGKILPRIKDMGLILITFTLTVFAWIFFRSNDIGQAFSIITEILSSSFLTNPNFFDLVNSTTTISFLILFLIVEWLGREHSFALARLGLKWPRLLRYCFYIFLINSIFWFGDKEQEFIYFQF